MLMMFGDLGQDCCWPWQDWCSLGLIRKLKGFASLAAVIGGGPATLFGVLFCVWLENVLPSVWVRPDARHLTLLEVPVIYGVII